jgi:hypothetical protein
VLSPEKVALLNDLGVEAVIDRRWWAPRRVRQQRRRLCRIIQILLQAPKDADVGSSPACAISNREAVCRRLENEGGLGERVSEC